MKKITFIILILSALPLGIKAQNEQSSSLSPDMEAFKDYCIRVANAAVTCNTDDLSSCIEKWEPAEYDGDGNLTKAEKLIYNNEELEYTAFSDLVDVDVSNEEILGMHFGFLPEAVDNWITNKCEAVELADANMLRGDAVNFEYTVRALKPQCKATYSTRSAGDIELFVVAENGGKITLAIHSVEKKNGEITNETTLSDLNGGQSAQLAWSMDRNGDIEITVENLTEKEISFIMVKKM